jgi:hypothetical protein
VSAGILDIRVSDPLPAPFPHEHAIEAYGVRLALGASDAELLRRVTAVLPPRARPCDPSTVRARFGLVRDEAGYRVVANDVNLSSPDADIAAGLLDALVRTRVAQHAPDRVFVHAGVVAHRGRAIVLPGRSMSGKTTLVAELVRGGATYYSEEYAVVGPDGVIHPYPKPLSIKANGADTTVESLGGVAGTEPVRAGLVAFSTYAPGAEWRPSPLSPAQGAIELLSHALVARERPGEAMAAATRLVKGAVVFKGERGEAAGVAAWLLAALERA